MDHTGGPQKEPPDPIKEHPCRRNVILASDLVAGKPGVGRVAGDCMGRRPKAARLNLKSLLRRLEEKEKSEAQEAEAGMDNQIQPKNANYGK